jgi:hypothetical protein
VRLAKELEISNMASDRSKLAWNLFGECRKDIIEHQKLRAQILGFKITIVGAGIGIIVTNMEKISSTLLIVPALAAIFFDLLLAGYSFSVKRTGYYCKKHIEPILRESMDWPDEALLWEEFMSKPKAKQKHQLFSVLGITTLAVIPAIVTLFFPFRIFLSSSMLMILIALFIYEVYIFLQIDAKYS